MSASAILQNLIDTVKHDITSFPVADLKRRAVMNAKETLTGYFKPWRTFADALDLPSPKTNQTPSQGPSV